MMEAFEPRLLLSAMQVGTVTMPYSGYLSAGIYDSNGVLVRTLLARQSEPIGPVTLTWDGTDDLGRTLPQDGTYTWKALYSQVQATQEGGVGDTSFTTSNWGANAGYDVQSIAVNTVGTTSGEVGGVFARNDTECTFGDTHLSQSYTLNTPISASGVFYFDNPETMAGKAFIGHYSAATGDNNREFIGLEFGEGDANEWVNVRARIYRFNGEAVSDAYSQPINLSEGTGYYNWDYSYDPTYEGNAAHAGPEGRLTVHVYNNSGVNVTLYAVNDGTHRDAGSTFDSFGMGIVKMESMTGANPAATAEFYMDNVSYSGHTGTVDFSTDPGWTGISNTSKGNNFTWKQYVTADGSLFQASGAEEGNEIRKLSASGAELWASGASRNFGIAADDMYTYVTQTSDGVNRIQRFYTRDGGPAGWPNGSPYIIVNNSVTDPRPSGQTTYTPAQWRQNGALWGIAADGYRLYVSDYNNNKLLVYDRNSGQLLGQYTIASPLGIAVDTASSASATIWVANSGSKVTKITYTAATNTFTAGTSITGLSDPSGVAIGGPNHHMFVAETIPCTIREYSIAGTPTPAGLVVFGSRHGGGALGPTQFWWRAYASIAIDQTGILSVLDDNRIQQFYTVTGGGHTAGDVYNSLFSEFGPCEGETWGYQANGAHFLRDGRYEFEVDPEYTGGPRAGWMGDGTWRLTGRYYNQDTYQQAEEEVNPAYKLTLGNGQTYYYQLTQNSVSIDILDAAGQHHSGYVGIGWRGVDRLSAASQGGQFMWVDSNGDHTMNWNGYTSEGHAADEITWQLPAGQTSTLTTAYVDQQGTIYFIDTAHNILKLPLHSIDSLGNPIYDWADMKTAAAFQTYPDLGLPFYPLYIHVASNGDIIATGWSSVAIDQHNDLGHGDWIGRFNAQGQLTLMKPTPDDGYGAANIEVTSATPQYYFTAEIETMHVVSYDGLEVASYLYGQGTPYAGYYGWTDNPVGVTGFVQPLTGKMYVYTEEVYFGQSLRFRVDNLATIQRSQGTFTYTAPTGPTHRWTMDGNLNDSAGTSTSTFNGGSPNYSAGTSGSALNLQGSQYVDMSADPDCMAFTITAWVKPSTVSNVNIIAGMTNGYPNNESQQLRINANSHFEARSHDSLIVAGTTEVVADNWYNVAITATYGGLLRLYVNGKEEGTTVIDPQSWTNSDFYRIGGFAAFTSNYNGLIDDVQVFNKALSAADIQAIYGAGNPVVSVLTTDPTGREQASDTATFTIVRNGTSGNLTVNYTLGGQATNGSDYSALPGFVVIPDGQTSATVVIAPIDDTAYDAGETVILTLASGPYTISSPSTGTAMIIDNDTADPGWLGLDNTVNGNNFGWSNNTNYAGGAAGEIGGTFVRTGTESWYGDVNLSRSYTLNDTITASGKFYVGSFDTVQDGKFFVGHYSKSTSDIAREFMGLEVVKGDWAGAIGVRARIFRFNGDPVSDAMSGYYNIAAGAYLFDYTYDPNYEGDPSHAGPEGRLALHLYNAAHTVDFTLYAINAGTHRDAGSTFDSFGIGISKNESFTGSYPTQSAKAYIDDLAYSGKQDPPSSVSVVATAPGASEPGTAGTFKITRTGTTGSLTVYYAVAGSATNGTDYSNLGNSVVILNGQSSTTITVNPIADSSTESDETVILTLQGSASYYVDAPNTATVTIADAPVHPGDANRSGSVDFNDYLILEANFGATSGVTWSSGDFNNDNHVDFNDYLTLEANFGWAGMESASMTSADSQPLAQQALGETSDVPAPAAMVAISPLEENLATQTTSQADLQALLSAPDAGSLTQAPSILDETSQEQQGQRPYGPFALQAVDPSSRQQEAAWWLQFHARQDQAPLPWTERQSLRSQAARGTRMNSNRQLPTWDFDQTVLSSLLQRLS